MRWRTRERRAAALYAAAAAAAAVALPACASGVTYTYNGPSGGNWNAAANWTPAGGPPAMGDTADFTTISASDFTINFNRVYAGTGLTSLFIDPSGTGNLILSQTLSTSVMIAESELLGDHADGAASAIYTQSAGSNSASTLTLGKTGGSGIYNQSGGVNNVDSIIYLGGNSGGVGTYNLAADGTLNSELVFVGNNGTGVFNQSGGNHTVYFGSTDGLFIGMNAGSTGTYNLSNSASLSCSGTYETVGERGTGTFNQTGGSNFSETLTVADFGTGTFNQSGGSNHSVYLLMANGAAAIGTYNLSNSAELKVNFSENIGGDGTGSFNQSGGSNSCVTLNIALDAGSTGTYSLSNSASLTVTGSEFVGLGGTGTFNQTGGTHTISAGSLVISATPGTSSGVFNMQGGLLSAGTIQLNTGGIFNLTGGTLSYTTFNMAGGTVTGTLQNQGTFNYTNGTFSGRLLNQGVVNLGSSFTAGNGMENDSVLTVAAGQTITLNGAGLDNEGTLTMTGGTLVLSTAAVNVNRGNFNLSNAAPFQFGAAPILNGGAFNLNGSLLSGSGGFTNGAGGTITGPGTISAPFSNTGGTMVVPDGALNVTNSFANSGYIQLGGFSADLTGGVIANTGTIQGVGTVSSPVNNSGIIEAIGGTLALSGSVTNSAGGLLAATTGNKLLFTGGLPANAGAITLTGGTFDNNGYPLVNNGQINGYGILRSGGLTNSPGKMITLNGGFTSISGDVTNSAGATIRAALNPVLFTGNVVNNGIIKVTGAPTNTVTIAGTYSGSGSYVSDPADNYFLSDVNVSAGGLVSGATGDRFFISGTYVNAGTYNNNGGSLIGQNIINTGSFNQSAGQATILGLSGTGVTTVGGGGAGTALVSVSSLSQGAVTINTGGTLTIRSAASRLTNSATNLQINGNGTLDLSNHELLTNTSPAAIKSYLANAYDPNGNADWGQPGLTSSVARNNPITYSVGYANGTDPSAQDAGVTTHNGTPLGANQTIVRPVLTGDANMDGVVDFFDITQILGYKYNTGQQASYTDGDLDYSGRVDFFDIVLLLSANYNSGQTYLGAHAASPTLTNAAAHVASSAAPSPPQRRSA
jgi:hypothetical protein